MRHLLVTALVCMLLLAPASRLAIDQAPLTPTFSPDQTDPPTAREAPPLIRLIEGEPKSASELRSEGRSAESRSAPFYIGLALALVLSIVAGAALWRYYRGEDPSERKAARERENAALRETAGTSIFGYLVLRVLARWIGTTPRDRRLVALACLSLLTVFLGIIIIDVTRSGNDMEDVVRGLLLVPVVFALVTVAVLFRLPR